MGPLRALLMLLSGHRRDAASLLPAGVRVERDLPYGADPAQRLDVYLPPGRLAGPVIVLVHGGAWALGDKAAPGVVVNKLAHWLPRGYTVVSVNYRLLPAADPLEQARDLARAIALVQQRAPSWGADATRLVLMGHSTGAHLAALLAADAELAQLHGAAPWLGTVLLDSAALDVVRTMSGPHRPLHDRAFGADRAYWEQASPLHRLRARPAPLLLVHSSERSDSADQASRFAAAVTALHGRADVVPVPLTHAELNGQLGRDPEYTARVNAFLRSLGLP